MSVVEIESTSSAAGPGEESPFSDDELTALAMAADPDQPLADDAVSIFDRDTLDGLLPGWYMPAATSRHRTGWRVGVIGLIITGFLVVAGSGFCITYGVLQVV